jgi:two-component system, NarL family, nitrate/nitrite response regulator NarL
MGFFRSKFEPLTDAWAPALGASRPCSSSEAARGAAAPSTDGWPAWAPSAPMSDLELDSTARAEHKIGIVVVAAPRVGDGAAPGPAHLLVDQLAGCRAFRASAHAPENGEALGRLLREQRARLLMIDVAWAHALGLDALRHARRLSPGTDWALLWDESTPHGFELAVACHARGCVDWQMPTDRLMQAVRTMLGGQLWFPRRAMESLYFSLLAATQPEPPVAPEFDLAAATARKALSARESEVLGLIREGLSNQEIADRMKISVNTVKKHLAHAYEKRGLHQRRQLMG